jgi:hypothetical protein
MDDKVIHGHNWGLNSFLSQQKHKFSPEIYFTLIGSWRSFSELFQKSRKITKGNQEFLQKPTCLWVAIKRWGQKKWCNIGRQPCCEFSLTSNECRISNQRLIHATVSWIVSWNHFVDRKYVVYAIHCTIHEDDNPRVRQLNVNETWKISVLTVVLNKKTRWINFL